jgi:hypothetical protein
VVEWITAAGVVASIVWNFINHLRSGGALRIARFERDVAAPLLQAIAGIERASDACVTLLYARGSFDEKKQRVEQRLWDEVGMAHAALQRNLRRAITTPRSRFVDWDEIVRDDLDDNALDALANAVEADTEDKFNQLLEEASRGFEEVANRARSKIEREN